MKSMRVLMKAYLYLIGILIVASCAVGVVTSGSNSPKSITDLNAATVPLQSAQSSRKELISKIEAFRVALKKEALNQSDWKLHDSLFNEYKNLKYGVLGTRVKLPARSRSFLKFPSFCLNPGRAVPSEVENFKWIKASPAIPYYKDLIRLSSLSKNKGQFQSLLWNLQSKTHWEQYPEDLKKIILEIDPQAPFKLPSTIKSKAANAISDFIESQLPEVSTAKELIHTAEGKFQDLKSIERQLDEIISKYPIEVTGSTPVQIPGVKIWVTTKSNGYSSQEITLYNPSDEEQTFDLTEYYLQPIRQDVQRIGLAGSSDDIDLLIELEKLLFDEMLRIGVGFTPGVNDAVDIYELLIGKDFISGASLSLRERALSGLGLLVGSGSGYRFAERAAEAPPSFLRNFEEGLSKTSRKAANIDQTEAKSILKQSEVSLSERRRASKIRTYSAEQANSGHLHQKNPPFLKGTKVVEFRTIEGDEWVRLHGENNQVGRWVVREESIRGLSPNELKVKYSLPVVPTHISKVTPTMGVKVRRGRVAENFGGHQGATQYEFLDVPMESWYKNMRQLNVK